MLAREIGDCLFVDMGSTTTDLIPIKGEALAAKTDFLRLAGGDLVYMGLLRTRLDALLPAATHRRAEGAACARAFRHHRPMRIWLWAGSPRIAMPARRRTEQERTARQRCAGWRALCAPTWRRSARLRALAIAEQACERQKSILVAAMERQAEKHGLTKVAAAGIGEELIAEAAAFLGLECLRLSEKYGAEISDVFPAYAVARLAETDVPEIARV